MGLEPHHWLDLARLAGFCRLSALWALIKTRLPSMSSQIHPAQAPPVEPAFGTAGCTTHGILYGPPVAVWRLTPVAFCRLYLCRIQDVHSTPTFAWPPGPGWFEALMVAMAVAALDQMFFLVPARLGTLEGARVLVLSASGHPSGARAHLWAHCTARKPVLEWDWTVDLCPVHPPDLLAQAVRPLPTSSPTLPPSVG